MTRLQQSPADVIVRESLLGKCLAMLAGDLEITIYLIAPRCGISQDQSALAGPVRDTA